VSSQIREVGKLAVVLSILLILLATPAAASTFVLMSDELLASSSDGAWLATVESVVSGMTAEGRVYTYVTLAADQKLRGPEGMPDQIILRELGGRAGETDVVAFGAPAYTVGEQVVVFLEQAPDGAFRTYQMAMGKFRVETDPETGQASAVRDWGVNPGRITVVDSAGSRTADATPDSRPLAALLGTISEAAVSSPSMSLAQPIVARPAELDRMETEVVADPFTFLSTPSRVTTFPTPLLYTIDTTPPATIASHVALLGTAMAGWTKTTNNISLGSAGTADLSTGFVCGPNKIENEDPIEDIVDPVSCSGVLAIGGYCTSGGTHAGPNSTTFRTITTSMVVFADGWGGCSVWTGTNYTEIGTHELGHSLGAGHSGTGADPDLSHTEANMFAFCCNGRGATASNITRTDDEMWASFAYPATVNPAVYVLDGFGGLHRGGSATAPSPAPPYFGFDIARDFALTGVAMGYVLDGFGGVHPFGGASAPSPATPYFGFDIARSIGNVPGSTMFYVLDGFGGVHTGNGAAAMPGSPYFGFDISSDIEVTANGAAYVLDGFGGLHTLGTASPISPAPPYFGFDIARAFTPTSSIAPARGYVLDGFGGVHRAGYPAVVAPATSYFGFDVAEDVMISDGIALWVLDGFGGVHPGGAGNPLTPGFPYFGFDILRAGKVQ